MVKITISNNLVVFIINTDLQSNINEILGYLGDKSFVETRKFYIGKKNAIEVAIIFSKNLADKKVIERNILNPLMLHLDEKISIKGVMEYLYSTCITSSSVVMEQDIQKVVNSVKNGNTVLILDGENDYIIIDTQGGTFRQISEPPNESSVRGSREGFVENIDINVSIIKRIIKDKNLVIENFVVGRRSQTRLAAIYISDIVDKDIYNELKKRIDAIDTDFVTASGMIEQFIDVKTYNIFPQAFSTERPDRVVANMMEGKIAIILDGSPTVLTVPAIIHEFMNTVEDYYSPAITSSALRLLRHLAIFIALFFPSIYLVLIKFNSELIPVEFIEPIVQSRSGISLTPFLEIFILEILVEFLREGGLRLPSKIAQTLSIVGGIIIGDTAVKSNMVSPTTLLVVGITVVASFLIPNYEMSLSIRFLRIIMLFVANFAGILGISVGIILLITHLSSLENFGVPYMTFYKRDMKDIFIRAPLRKMNLRPTSIPNDNSTRQGNSREV